MRLLISLLALLFLAGCASTPPTRSGIAKKTTGRMMTVRTTAYTHTEPGGIRNAIGSRLRFGGEIYSAASDWSWLPLGTRFRMLSNGRTFVIEDYGSALVGRQTVDLYMPTRRMMNAWGVRHEPIEILEWGSRPMSLKMLAPRTRNRHVAVMVAQLRKQGVRPPS